MAIFIDCWTSNAKLMPRATISSNITAKACPMVNDNRG
jgi:hypothetical protein